MVVIPIIPSRTGSLVLSPSLPSRVPEADALGLLSLSKLMEEGAPSCL